MAQIDIAKSKQWKKDKINEGWEETPFGLLPKEEIHKAGFAWNRESQQWLIPQELYIAEQNVGGRKKGEKYWGVSRQFFKWHKDYNERRYNNKDIDTQIQKETGRTREVTNENNDIDVNKMIF